MNKIFENRLKGKNKEILTMMILFACYLYYSQFIDGLLNMFNVKENLFSTYIADITFMFGIAFFYFDYIINSFKKLKGIKISKIIGFVIKNLIILIAIIILTNILRVVIFPNEKTVINDDLVNNLNFYYKSFKILFFAVIAEELLFRKTVRDIIDNKIIFIITSALIYSYLNIAFLGVFNAYIIYDFVAYFLGYIFLNYLYVKTDNILAPMSIKFTYALLFIILSI